MTYNFLKQFEETQKMLEKISTELSEYDKISHESDISDGEIDENPQTNQQTETSIEESQMNVDPEEIFKNLINLDDSDVIKIEVYSDDDQQKVFVDKTDFGYNLSEIKKDNIKVILVDTNETGCSVVDENIYPITEEKNLKDEISFRKLKGGVEVLNTMSKRHRKSKSPVEPKDTYQPVLYTCPVCNRRFKTLSVFRGHLVGHRQKTIKCTFCPDIEINIYNYVEHYNVVHKYQCHICNKSLTSSYGLMYHMTNHKEQKPYVCWYENCEKRFSLYSLLKKHLEVHSDEKKYLCGMCEASFNTYDTFRYHQKTHNGQRNHLCPDCGKTYYQACHLRDHIFSKHTNNWVFCKYCSAKYKSPSALRQNYTVCKKKRLYIE